ncbi:hypothetical protein [Planctomyces sp. SH-PL14]|uniref:hypothetical protein n=1 Tax=Planctomyces sp. SH-PL14 TaxID=1632864 RepID=UPI00078B40E1|nr:hypothetical protein [Planctomyces sp. SH-PL14]AMV18208.1 hypothetical protein VT03_09990 [Planctomyces sp. SH-PL14]
MLPVSLINGPEDLAIVEAFRAAPRPLLRLAPNRAEALRLAAIFAMAAESQAARIAELTRGMKPGDVIEVPGPVYFAGAANDGCA